MKSLRVSALLICVAVTDYGSSKEVHFHASTDGEGSKDFTKYTPSADLKITIDAEAAAATAFEPRKRYLITFEPEDQPDVLDQDEPRD